MSQTPSCEERIEANMEERIEFIDKAMKWESAWNQSGNWQRAETARERLDNLPLAIDKRTIFKIELSTGGPADWFEVQLDDEGYLVTIEYHFADWFDHAERELSGEEFDIVSRYIEGYLGLDNFVKDTEFMG